MKKLITAVIILLALFAYSKTLNIDYSPKVKTTSDKEWSITANYPVFSGDRYKECNKIIKSVIDSFYDDWENFFTTSYVRMEPDGKGGTDLEYEIFYADTEAVSILFHANSYTGGMHTMNEYFSINYDNIKNRRADITDIMIDDILPQLSDYCKRDFIRQTAKTGEWSEEMGITELEPTLSNFNVFNATREALYFTINKGKFTGYSNDAITIEVTQDSLLNLME